ncbi:MAG: hypothetical protein WKF78_11515 [Candidatus Limnocylindrales bacterium]
MDHALLVASLEVAKGVLGRFERLTHPRDVAVPEDAEHAGKEWGPAGVTLHRLHAQVGDERLRDRQAAGGGHRGSLEVRTVGIRDRS